MGFFRQEYWSGLSVPFPGDLSDPGIEPGSPTLQADSLPSEPHLEVSQFDVVLLSNFCFWYYIQKIIAETNLRELFHYLGVLWFQVLGLSLIHFELIFVCVVR